MVFYFLNTEFKRLFYNKDKQNPVNFKIIICMTERWRTTIQMSFLGKTVKIFSRSQTEYNQGGIKMSKTHLKNIIIALPLSSGKIYSGALCSGLGSPFQEICEPKRSSKVYQKPRKPAL